MNSVLEEILRSGTVSNGREFLPLHSNMDAEEGDLIRQAILASRPTVSLEIGCAYGISTLFACDAFAEVGAPARHIVIDPMQSTYWDSIGISNVCRAGYRGFVELIEEGSESALAQLFASGLRIQFAIIDGWHTFDHALVDFFYINKMLDVCGIVILDDTNWPALARLSDHVLSYPAYELFGSVGEPRKESGFKAVRAAVRRALAARVSPRLFKRSVDYPRCIAFQKVAEDQRSWDWDSGR